MRILRRCFLVLPCVALACAPLAQAQTAPAYPVYQVTNSTPPTPAPAPTPAPPPSGPAKRSAADLEKLVAPIALYPDPLIATLLPASVYPLEIVQAARFVADTNNLAKLDAQPWDDNVKAIARVPEVLKKMNDDLPWTVELGEAFLAQDKDVMDMIQSLRLKAQKTGNLQTTPQQVVVVTNVITEKTVQQQVVVVTNTVVQIQPSNPQVVYVPTYNPYTVYYPPPAYVYNPYAPAVTFAAGIAVGAIIANNCDWYHGGCYHGSYHGGGNQININGDVNINRGNVNTGNINTGNINSGNRATVNNTTQKWQPDQSRLSKSGSTAAASSARTAEARGWSGGASATATGAGARPSTGAATARPTTGNAAARPTTGTTSFNRPTTTPSAASRPTTTQARPTTTSSRPTSSGSAFGGAGGGASAQAASNRGASSRSFSGGGGGGGGRSFGGGGRGGGGRR